MQIQPLEDLLDSNPHACLTQEGQRQTTNTQEHAKIYPEANFDVHPLGRVRKCATGFLDSM
jgi:hypothetical protein